MYKSHCCQNVPFSDVFGVGLTSTTPGPVWVLAVTKQSPYTKVGPPSFASGPVPAVRTQTHNGEVRPPVPDLRPSGPVPATSYDPVSTKPAEHDTSSDLEAAEPDTQAGLEVVPSIRQNVSGWYSILTGSQISFAHYLHEGYRTPPNSTMGAKALSDKW